MQRDGSSGEREGKKADLLSISHPNRLHGYSFQRIVLTKREKN